jgi:hypothetical protein
MRVNKALRRRLLGTATAFPATLIDCSALCLQPSLRFASATALPPPPALLPTQPPTSIDMSGRGKGGKASSTKYSF